VPAREGRRRRLLLGAAVLAVLPVLGGCGDEGARLAERRAEVAERGARVMPFDLDATTHRFTDTARGGIQTVTADDPDDADQIELIRAHLLDERDKFARGDFEDPAAIHGHDMEGVAELTAGYRDIAVTYTDVPDGGRLTYATDDADLVDAVHAWFARQVMDHGTDAETRRQGSSSP
jgi:hypothetical protein